MRTPAAEMQDQRYKTDRTCTTHRVSLFFCVAKTVNALTEDAGEKAEQNRREDHGKIVRELFIVNNIVWCVGKTWVLRQVFSEEVRVDDVKMST